MRCQPNGNFDSLQCVTGYSAEDMCFCVGVEEAIDDVSSDHLVTLNGTRAFLTSVESLSCYDDGSDGENIAAAYEDYAHERGYFRPCELEVRRREREKEVAASQGRILHIFKPEPVCSPDGCVCVPVQ